MKEVSILKGQPSRDYEMIYLNLADSNPCWVGERIDAPHNVVDIRALKSLNHDQKRMLSSIRHPNFATVHEIYRSEEKYFVVYEHMPRSLDEFMGHPYLNRFRLAAIVRQAGRAGRGRNVPPD
jgi:hypothetical protein